MRLVLNDVPNYIHNGCLKFRAPACVYFTNDSNINSSKDTAYTDVWMNFSTKSRKQNTKINFSHFLRMVTDFATFSTQARPELHASKIFDKIYSPMQCFWLRFWWLPLLLWETKFIQIECTHIGSLLLTTKNVNGIVCFTGRQDMKTYATIKME